MSDLDYFKICWYLGTAAMFGIWQNSLAAGLFALGALIIFASQDWA